MRLIQGDYKNIKRYFEKNAGDHYFEFEFMYTSENEKFKEIDRYLWESRHLNARFKNRYTGTVVIGITEWNHKELNKYFNAFMYFLKDLSRECDLYLFIEEKSSDRLLGRLKEYFQILNIEELELSDSNKENNFTIGFKVSDNYNKEEFENV